MKFWNVAFILLTLIVILAWMNSPANGTNALILGVVTLVYFLPSYVAARREVLNPAPTQVVNFFLGWTLVGWVVALVLATSAKTKAEFAIERPAPTATKQCPQCAERVQLAAKICRFCRYEFPAQQLATTPTSASSAADAELARSVGTWKKSN